MCVHVYFSIFQRVFPYQALFLPYIYILCMHTGYGNFMAVRESWVLQNTYECMCFRISCIILPMENEKVERLLFIPMLLTLTKLGSHGNDSLLFLVLYGEFTLCIVQLIKQYLFLWATLCYSQTSDSDKGWLAFERVGRYFCHCH